MNLKTKLAAAMVLAASASVAHAATYSVSALFNEPMINGSNTAGDTYFKGTFDWDGTSVSNFSGTMNESMQGPWTTGAVYNNYPLYTSVGTNGDLYPAQNTYKGQVADLGNTGLYMLTLDKNLQQNSSGGYHYASIFKENTSDVWAGGGYAASGGNMGMFGKYGSLGDGNTPNQNAFFTLVFSKDGLGNITSLGLQTLGGNAALINKMIYGDCTIGSLMGSQANMCMAGEVTGGSMMMGTPLSLEINQVAAVPVPAAAWLFGGALMSLLGVNRRKNVLSA